MVDVNRTSERGVAARFSMLFRVDIQLESGAP